MDYRGLMLLSMALGVAGPLMVAWMDRWPRWALIGVPVINGAILEACFEGSSREDSSSHMWPMLFGVTGLGISMWFAFRKSQPSSAGWIAACVSFAGVVGTISGSSGGSGSLKMFLIQVGMSGASSELAVFLIRKATHFSAYGMLAFLVSRLMLEVGVGQKRFGVWPALIWVLCIASFDEIRQASAPGRTGQFSDVLIDLGGAVVVLALLSVIRRRRAVSA